MAYQMIIAEVRADALAYEVLLNGAVVERSLAAHDAVNMNKLNAYVVEGDNRLTVNVAPMKDEEEISSRGRLELTVHEGEHGKHPGEAGKRASAAWGGGFSPEPGASRWLNVHDETLAVEQRHGRWVWEDARPFRLADRPTIESILAQYHAALARGSFVECARWTVVRDTELARGLDVSLAKLLAFEQQMIEGVFAEPTWEMAPFDPMELVMHPRADGRLVEVTDRWRGAPLRGSCAGEPFAFDVTFSHLPDGWAIVR